jgi:hypothetical protein
MIEYDINIINRLMSVSDTNEGSLFNNTAPCVKLQVEFIERILEKYRPKYIIETGTNKAFFCLFVFS